MKILRHAVIQSPRHALGAVAATAAIALRRRAGRSCLRGRHDQPAVRRRRQRPLSEDRADCNAGKTAEDRATCLKEAGAAQAERKRHQLDTNGSTAQNAADRCNLAGVQGQGRLPGPRPGRRRANQRVTTSGSVAGGGMLRKRRRPRPARHRDPGPGARAGCQRRTLTRIRRRRKARGAAAILATPFWRAPGRPAHHRHRVGHQLVARRQAVERRHHRMRRGAGPGGGVRADGVLPRARVRRGHRCRRRRTPHGSPGTRRPPTRPASRSARPARATPSARAAAAPSRKSSTGPP